MRQLLSVPAGVWSGSSAGIVTLPFERLRPGQIVDGDGDLLPLCRKHAGYNDKEY